MTCRAWALALCLAAAPAAAQEAADDGAPMAVNGAWAKPDQCNPGNAMRLAFADARRRHRELDGRCVAIAGYWRTDGLFADAAHARPRDALSSDAAQDARIGLYGNWAALGSLPAAPRRATAVGLLADCDRWSGSMIMGYCHHSGGPVLILSTIERR